MDWKEKRMSRSQYSSMRDIVIHYILFTTSSCDGVLIEVLMEEFRRVKWIQLKEGKGKVFQVEVFRHKTLLTSGSARLNLSKQVFKWVNNYILYIRPQVLLPHGRDTKSEPHILLPWSRKTPKSGAAVKMSSGSISKRLRSMFV